MSTPEVARKLKDLEKENARLKKLVVDLSLNKAMLQEVASGNFEPAPEARGDRGVP